MHAKHRILGKFHRGFVRGHIRTPIAAGRRPRRERTAPPGQPLSVNTKREEHTHDTRLPMKHSKQYIPKSTQAPRHPTPLYMTNLGALAQIPFPPDVDGIVGDIGGVSAEQRDAVALIRARHMQSKPFLLCDSTGSGKGRTLIASAKCNVSHGDSDRILFVSASNLLPDLKRDVAAVTPETRVYDIRKSALPPSGILFCPHASLSSNIKAIKQWLRETSTVIFDECHFGRSISGKSPCAGAVAMREIWVAFPRRVVLATATAADSLNTVDYILPILGDESITVKSLRDRFGQNHAAASLELVYHEMVAMGAMISRQIGAEGVEFRSIHVPVPDPTLWDQQACLWTTLLALPWPDGDIGVVSAAAQRFGLARILHSKIEATIKAALDAIDQHKQAVISMTSTDESNALKAAANSEETAGLEEAVMQVVRLAEKRNIAPEGIRSRVNVLCLEKNSPLAILKRRLGGSAAVAELSGRQTFVDFVNGAWVTEKRSQDVTQDRADFQAGRKKIAILTSACGVGTSLHDQNGHRRLHILFQLAWSSSATMQVLGRTHRAGQRSAPEYVLVCSTFGPERRVSAAVGARLSVLGAISSGDREGTRSGEFDSQGAEIMQHCTSSATKILRDKNLEHLTSQLQLGGEVRNGRVFLNRLLVAKVRVAEALFDEFLERVHEAALEAERKGSCKVTVLSPPRATLVGKIGDADLYSVRKTLTYDEALERKAHLESRGNAVFFTRHLLIWRRSRTVSVIMDSSGHEYTQSGCTLDPAPADVASWDRSATMARDEEVAVLQLPCLSKLMKRGYGVPTIARIKVGDGERLGVCVEKGVAEKIVEDAAKEGFEIDDETLGERMARKRKADLEASQVQEA